MPGTSGFIGEILVLIGVFQVNSWVALLATSGVVLSAAYALWLYRRVMFGNLVKPELKLVVDLNWREKLIFAPLVIVALWMGIWPAPFIDVTTAAVQQLISQHHAGLAPVDGAAAALAAAR